jgi:6-phosphofructokinase 1
MNKIGILTSGGDAPGMNACIRAIVRKAIFHDLEPVGIRRGFTGMLNAELQPIDRRFVANIIQRGGTILETSRCPEMLTVEGRKKGILTLDRAGIDHLIVIGGDGTFHGADELSKECDVKIMGVPATIDNDVYGSDFTIGFDTAVNTALGAIDRIRDTADSHERIFIVEVMGRSSGFIALEVGIAGGAEDILVPEKKEDLQSLCSRLQDSYIAGKRSSIIIVAEGSETGNAMSVASYIDGCLKTSCRVCILGHIQRGGSPTARDRVLASKLGVAAVDGLLQGKSGYAVGEYKGEIAYTPLKEAWGKKKELDFSLLEASQILAI